MGCPLSGIPSPCGLLVKNLFGPPFHPQAQLRSIHLRLSRAAENNKKEEERRRMHNIHKTDKKTKKTNQTTKAKHPME